MAEALDIRVLTGAAPALRAHLPDLARLRISVFREFPYLYDGTPEYEEKYLQIYLDCAESVVVLALDAGRAIGASTGLPLACETEEFTRPFIAAGLDPARIFYCGESVLLPAYRGRGLYKQFFAAREAHARALGRFDRMVLCAVERPADHPRRPSDYQPLDAVWQRFAYRRRPDLFTHFAWKDLDEATESPKRMVFWEKSL
ncbi:MAG TPA: GNAT family N-acetyltransferase [Gammaproteobacteria bacterium]|nr:GNAT family N-acetyltransferase [Gammaproteobacteria bacterium]